MTILCAQQQIATLGSRLTGMDAARGVALLGMIAVHGLGATSGSGGPNAAYLIAGGRSAGTFALLTGVAVTFITGRAQVKFGSDARAAAATLLARATAIGLLGLALGYTDATVVEVILPYYAELFLLAIPLVFLPTRVLAALAVLIAVVVPTLSQLLRPRLPIPTLDNPDFAYLLRDPLALLSELSLTGHYPALPWLAYICAGMAIGRLRLSRMDTAAGLLVGGTVLGIAVSAASWVLLGPLGGLAHIQAATPLDQLATAPTVADYVEVSGEGTTPTTTWWWLASAAPHSGTTLDLAQTAGAAMALLGAMLLLTQLIPAKTTRRPGLVKAAQVASRPLAAAGGMTLTLYTASVVFMNSPLDDFSPLGGYLLQVTVALLFALAWRYTIGRGPLETVVTTLTRVARNLAR
ncbi:MAG: DUF1624 domain-containing protein [Pseudonocardia sp.]|nr:DUF1624 domain-containing protein [Pseudonocardia sp.]